jgi:hypothetical protein
MSAIEHVAGRSSMLRHVRRSRCVRRQGELSGDGRVDSRSRRAGGAAGSLVLQLMMRVRSAARVTAVAREASGRSSAHPTARLSTGHTRSGSPSMRGKSTSAVVTRTKATPRPAESRPMRAARRGAGRGRPRRRSLKAHPLHGYEVPWARSANESATFLPSCQVAPRGRAAPDASFRVPGAVLGPGSQRHPPVVVASA